MFILLLKRRILSKGVMKMNILVTGAFGNVGRSTVKALQARGEHVRILEQDNRAARKTARSFDSAVDIRLGDILNIGDVIRALEDIDSVIHLAAIIPPAADRNPEAARLVNVEGTRNLLYCMERNTHSTKKSESGPGKLCLSRIVFASSIAVYGDRRSAPFIRADDHPAPNPNDHYALQKLECEKMVRNSSLEWTILRLSYIADPYSLKLDPLMFEMPLETSLEICHTLDAGTALAEAAVSPEVTGKILQIAGGWSCRTSYQRYLERMLTFMGLDRTGLPECAFSKSSFHCAFMDTGDSERLLRYQNHSLEDFYSDVKRIYSSRRLFVRILHKTANKILYLKSPYFMHQLRAHLGTGLTTAALRLKYLFTPGLHFH